MADRNQNTDNKSPKKLEEAELTVTLLGRDEVVTTSDCPEDCLTNCLAKGTRITLADGSVRCIEDIAEGDRLLTFDHEAGRFVGSEVIYVYRSAAPKRAFTCRFANGAGLSVVGEHDLFEQESRRYVTLTEENAEQFIGRHFYSAEEKAYVELVSVIHETEAVDYYELYTKKLFNTLANGMLNVADDVDYMLNIYEFDENLRADRKAFSEAVQKYGFFEYNSKYGRSEEDYDSWNMRYFRISVGMGLITWDKLRKQGAEYLDQRSGRKDATCA